MVCMSGVYFEGDPATDSARRHMERVLEGREKPSRWPWMLAALGSGGVWFLWSLGKDAARAQEGVEGKVSKEQVDSAKNKI